MALYFFLAIMLSQQEHVPEHTFSCGSNPNAKALASLIINHPSQNRETLTCNNLLAEIADKRAKNLLDDSSSDYVSANQFVSKNGFRFASYYPVIGNQVEAVVKKIIGDRHRL